MSAEHCSACVTVDRGRRETRSLCARRHLAGQGNSPRFLPSRPRQTAEPAPLDGAEAAIPALPSALTSESRDRALPTALAPPPGSAVLLGENAVPGGQAGALDRWCALAAARGVRILAGVLEPDRRATIREFAPDRCDAAIVYERRIGLPGIAGGWGFGAGHAGPVALAGRPVRWLICFEAFVPVAWVLARIPSGAVVVIAANDRWLHPVPAAVMRRKAARSMARLFGAAPAIAVTGRTAVIVQR